MKTINTANKDEIEKFKAQINGWITSIGLPYCLDDLTPDGGIYTIYCPVRWKGLYSAHELKTALKQDVDAQQINIEYIDFKRLIPPKQPLSTDKPSEDLEESIIEFLSHVPENEPDHSETLYTYEQMQEIARHFAHWQKEQIMKSAVDATCVVLPPPDVFKVLICHEVTDKLAIGQKVKVIVKED